MEDLNTTTGSEGTLTFTRDETDRLKLFVSTSYYEMPYFNSEIIRLKDENHELKEEINNLKNELSYLKENLDTIRFTCVDSVLKLVKDISASYVAENINV